MSLKSAPFIRIGLGLIIFGMAYAILNQYLLTQSILYRAAANDYGSAISAIVSFALQSIVLLAGVVFLPRRWFGVIGAIAILSAAINITYGQILNDTLDLQKTSWMLTEARQAGNAAGEFAMPVILAIGKIIAAILLLLVARMALRQPLCNLVQAHAPRAFLSPFFLVALLLAPTFLWSATGFGPEAAERNVIGYLARVVTAEPPPSRAAVSIAPQNAESPKKIVWVIDESVSHAVFSDVVKPGIAGFGMLDFGEAASMGNCSTPTHVALRSGVNVRQIDRQTDLRKTASIWGYARKAGFETILIDGQVTGPPQNLLLPPELKLIDKVQPVNDGLETDFKIAQHVNGLMKSEGQQFAYVLLRGVHFQYSDHFPKEDLVPGSSTWDQYKKAVAYSKRGFFKELLKGIDRSKVAIFYTSDHGQNIGEGVIPHCSNRPVPAEFSVPLLAFLPPEAERRYAAEDRAKRSLSQLFPTTLQLMGYDGKYARQNYDNDLMSATAQFVWFGRGVVPVADGDAIDLHKSPNFPGS